MSITSSIAVTAGHLSGRAFWDAALQTFAVELDVFDHGSSFPPPTVRHGARFAEYLTVDALVNHLRALDLGPDGASAAALDDLGHTTFAGRPRPEVVGLSGPGGDRHLHLLTPSGELVGIGPRCDHPDYRPGWGCLGPATVEAGRLICERVWVRHPHQDIEAFALALALEHLVGTSADFSLDAVDLCDWFLVDGPVGTALDPEDLRRLRRVVHGGSRPSRVEERG